MLTGKRAFGGTSVASVIAAILEREPEPLSTTPPLDRVIRTCLAKDPDRRFQTALDLKRNLLWAMEETAPVASKRGRLWMGIAAAVFALALGTSLWYNATRPAPPEVRTDIVTPPSTAPESFALSPDGQQIAYVAANGNASQLWVRSLASASEIGRAHV